MDAVSESMLTAPNHRKHSTLLIKLTILLNGKVFET